MVRTLLAQKKGMQQIWTADGKRLPVTKLSLAGNVVVRTAPAGRVQLAFGDKKLKNVIAPQRTLLEKIGLQIGKRVYKETEVDGEVQAGQEIRVETELSVGDIVKISGSAKGKGFAGVVKRHGFAGGPHTHGQSDRERAPGSIGQRTTPGRVFPGMRMAGRMGGQTVTLKTAQIVAIDPTTQEMWVRGTIPGSVNSILTIVKEDAHKDFVLTEQSKSLLGIVDAPVVAEPQAVEAPEVETADAKEQE